MPAIFPVGASVLVAYAFLYVGIAFTGARLFPSHLQAVYAATSPTIRLLAVTLICATPLNFVVNRSFGVLSPSIVTALVLGAQVFVLLGNASLMDGAIPPPGALLAAGASLACLVWFGFEVAGR